MVNRIHLDFFPKNTDIDTVEISPNSYDHFYLVQSQCQNDPQKA